MQERYIERKSVAWAKSRGWLVRKLQWIGHNGAPDRFFAKARRIVLIEFKQKGKKPTGLQAKEIENLRAAGVEVHVCDDIETVKAILEGESNPRKRRDHSDFI